MFDAIIAQLGIGTAVVAGLGGFLRAMLLAREQRLLQVDLERSKATTSQDLAKLTASLATQAELLRFNLKTKELVSSKQIAKEFEAYESLWEHVEGAYRPARSIAGLHELDMADITKIMRDQAAADLSKPWSEFERVFQKYAPFIHEDAYDALEHFRRVFASIWSADQLFESPFERRATSADLERAREAAMVAVRTRLGLANASPSPEAEQHGDLPLASRTKLK